MKTKCSLWMLIWALAPCLATDAIASVMWPEKTTVVAQAQKYATAELSSDRSRPVDQTLQSAMYGPYATMRRAEEVANEFRNRGLNAQAFHNGDGYYVRVWR